MVAIALNGGSKSKFIARWAIEKFVPDENVVFKLLHVYPKISGVPTPSKYTSIHRRFEIHRLVHSLCRIIEFDGK